MSKSVKKIDLSQIKYAPQENEIIQNSQDNEMYIYKNGSWLKIDAKQSGINLSLYDMNKQIVSQLPELTNLLEKETLINHFHNIIMNNFYMLYGKEISYFTLFQIFDASKFGYDVIDCLKNIGIIKAIDLTERADAIEIWVEGEDGPTCLYLFPYDSGLVKVGK